MCRVVFVVQSALVVLALASFALVGVIGLRSEASAVTSVPDPYDLKAVLAWPLLRIDIERLPNGTISRTVITVAPDRLQPWEAYQLARMRFEAGDVDGSAFAFACAGQSRVADEAASHLARTTAARAADATILRERLRQASSC
jgi:hypothetical protein